VRNIGWRVAFSHHQSHKKRARGFILVPSYSYRGLCRFTFMVRNAQRASMGSKRGFGRDSCCCWMTMRKNLGLVVLFSGGFEML